MKRNLLSCLVLLISQQLTAQDFFPSIQQLPTSGLEKIRQTQPYMLEQENDGAGNWNNYYLFTWIPASVTGYKKNLSIHNWQNESWHLSYEETDSFLGVNNNNQPLGAIQHLFYSYPNFNSEYRYRYAYNYNTDGSTSYFKMERETPVGSGQYQNFQETFIRYENGVRVSDSTISGSVQSISYYVYQNGHVVSSHTIDLSSNDTIARTFYGYQDTLPATIFSESKDPSTDIWETQYIDSVQYTNGKVTHHTLYGFSTINGGAPVFQPIEDEGYTYFPDGTLATIIEKMWMNNAWNNVSKYQFLYDGAGNPSLGLRFMANGATTYASEARYRFLFAPVSGVNNASLLSEHIDMFPNPANTDITINAPFQISNITLTDAQGKNIADVIIGCSADGYTIHTEHLENGVYFVQITSGDTRIFKKIMINH